MAATSAPELVRSWTVLLPTVLGSSASLKVAVTGAVASALVAAALGLVLVIVGGVVSAGAWVVKTTSTQ